MKSAPDSNHDRWRQFVGWLESHDADLRAEPRTLILAAHPDDETLGASYAMSCLPACDVAFLTDGAPQDASLRSADPSLPREAYAAIRAEESSRALACLDIGSDRIFRLNCPDQEAPLRAPELATQLASLIGQRQTEVVMTHAYEGGHPDHDAAALIAHLALEMIAAAGRRPPLLAEMALYHARAGRLITNEFLPGASNEFVVSLSRAERETKRRMLDCYASQSAVLQSFTTDKEAFRLAPLYDFSQSPHRGKLWYECLGWSMNGKQWCEMASTALAEFGQSVCR